MRTSLWRHRRKLTWVSLPVVLTALALQLTGHWDAALLLVAATAVLSVSSTIIDWRCKPPTPVLSDEEKAAIRDVRDSASEVTAIRMLRAAHPDFGLLEAAVMVREL